MKQKKRSTINISDIRLIHRFLQHNDNETFKPIKKAKQFEHIHK